MICQMTIIKLSEFLQKELDTRGWKAANLAEKAKLGPAIISRALNRERLPSPESLIAIAKALDYSPETLFRAVGWLPEISESDELAEKIAHLVGQMDDLERQDIYDYAAMVIQRQERRDLVKDFLARYRFLTREEAKEAQKRLFEELGIVKSGGRRNS